MPGGKKLHLGKTLSKVSLAAVVVVVVVVVFILTCFPIFVCLFVCLFPRYVLSVVLVSLQILMNILEWGHPTHQSSCRIPRSLIWTWAKFRVVLLRAASWWKLKQKNITSYGICKYIKSPSFLSSWYKVQNKHQCLHCMYVNILCTLYQLQYTANTRQV